MVLHRDALPVPKQEVDKRCGTSPRRVGPAQCGSRNRGKFDHTCSRRGHMGHNSDRPHRKKNQRASSPLLPHCGASHAHHASLA